ncbi:MAG: class II aldolase/adducin family protein [Lachnospiraceae bacterium]|nr:class II aldolase/adducin family protein [Lachnospiraceae bacterium]
MEYLKIRKELAEFCHYVYEKGYTQASGGNLSCRVPGTDLFAIKKTAVNMRTMTEQDVLIVDGNGSVVYGDGVPSKETGFHLGVLKLRPDMNAFVHCHPNFAIGIANNEMELPHTTVTSRKIVGRVPWIPSAPAGSDALREAVIDAFRSNPECNAILMKEHGICTIGVTLEKAYNLADLVEQTARQACIQTFIAEHRETILKMTKI